MADQKALEVVSITAPPTSQRVKRDAAPPEPGQRASRYTLPASLDSASPVGYRTRSSLDRSETTRAMDLLQLERPSAFVESDPVREQEIFEECSLGVLTSRQSTNYRGHRQVTLGPRDARELQDLLDQLSGTEAPVLDHASHAHVVLSRPYRTPFTLLLTFVGHAPVISLVTVPVRGIRKVLQGIDDTPSIGFLQHLHLGILAESLERAAVLASGGHRRAQVFSAPFCGAQRTRNRDVIKRIRTLCGAGPSEGDAGWRISLVAQVGEVPGPALLDPDLCRKLGANLLAFRSERIQPGVNQDDKATPPYRHRQDMDVPDALTVQAGRAAYNAFSHWTGCDRDRAKELLLLDRIDVLTPGGKERLRGVRTDLGTITDRVVAGFPWWADYPMGKALSRNAGRGRKAFALAGQRIYIGGLSRSEVEQAGLEWDHTVRAVGAAAARSALYCELMGCLDIPPDCDMLAGFCMMAGPVTQNDIGRQFYGYRDLL
ncbi:MAG: hypothetical protein QGG40_18840, partial [Myxococcota bacterium]|nr:hypothetical protein [Myxococcota bacterium]